MSYRVYNNAQYGQIAVSDGWQSGLQCGVAMTLTGVGIVGAIAAMPEDLPALAISWGPVAFGVGVTWEECWNLWVQTVQMDAFSRSLKACTTPQGGFNSLDTYVNIGFCTVMGWEVGAVDATMSIVNSVAATMTGCTGILIPVAIYDGSQWSIVRICN